MATTHLHFYCNILRFVAARADRADPRIDAMMVRLSAAAAEAEANNGAFTVPGADLAVAARAFAGVAGFLQQQILPEAAASGHDEVVAQLRWSVDTSMELMRQLVAHEAEGTGAAVTLCLPAVH